METNGALPHTQTLDQLLDAVLPIIEDFHDLSRSGESVVEYMPPEEIRRRANLDLPEQSPSSLEPFLSAVRDLFRFSVRTGHPLFLNRLYTGSDPTGQVAELITAVLNTSPDTFSSAPLLSVLTAEMVAAVGEKFGYPRDQCDGTFVPGGSYANLQAMTVARNLRFPEVRARGIAALHGRPVVFASEEAHFSIRRAAMVLGLGEDSCRCIPCDSNGAMLPSALDDVIRSLDSNEIPFFVCATAGTTVRGAFDPLTAIAKLCSVHGIWFHVDACWGGAMVFSERTPLRERLLSGCHLADSVAFSPHKVLGLPLQCSMLITRRRGCLREALASHAEYLFHEEFTHSNLRDVGEPYRDIGEKSLQCGRRSDVVKFWLYWKRFGVQGIRERVDRSIGLASEVTTQLKRHPGIFCLVSPPCFINVCFWVLPPSPSCCVKSAGGASPHTDWRVPR